jgi:hypothetical protein
VKLYAIVFETDFDADLPANAEVMIPFYDLGAAHWMFDELVELARKNRDFPDEAGIDGFALVTLQSDLKNGFRRVEQHATYWVADAYEGGDPEELTRHDPPLKRTENGSWFDPQRAVLARLSLSEAGSGMRLTVNENPEIVYEVVSVESPFAAVVKTAAGEFSLSVQEPDGPVVLQSNAPRVGTDWVSEVVVDCIEYIA